MQSFGKSLFWQPACSRFSPTRRWEMICSDIAFNLSLPLSACRFSLLLRAPHYFSCGIGSPVRLGLLATKALYVALIISIEIVPSIDPSNPAWKNHVKCLVFFASSSFSLLFLHDSFACRVRLYFLLKDKSLPNLHTGTGKQLGHQLQWPWEGEVTMHRSELQGRTPSASASPSPPPTSTPWPPPTST